MREPSETGYYVDPAEFTPDELRRSAKAETPLPLCACGHARELHWQTGAVVKQHAGWAERSKVMDCGEIGCVCKQYVAIGV